MVHHRKGRKSSTRLTLAITNLIWNFKRKPNVYLEVGTIEWGDELFNYIKRNGTTHVIREDIDRWMNAHAWIKEPIQKLVTRPIDAGRQSRGRLAKKIQHAATPNDSNIFADGTGPSSSKYSNPTKDPSKDKRMKGGNDALNKDTRQNSNWEIQDLAVGLSKLQELIHWLENRPALKRCLMDTTKILNHLQDEQRKHVLGDRAAAVQKPLHIKREEIMEVEVIPHVPL